MTLRSLHIKNLMLLEEISLTFEPGFHVITGESGAGKSALIQALLLLTGARMGAEMIRRDANNALIEATFFPVSKQVLDMLESGGVAHDPDEELIVRRELFQDGKSKVLINQHRVQLRFLKEAISPLLYFIAQHASTALLERAEHRSWLDHYAGSSALLAHYQSHYREQQKLDNELLALRETRTEAERRLQELEHTQRELKHAALRCDEEAALEAEFQRLSHFEVLASKLEEVIRTCTEGKQPILPTLHRNAQLLASLDSIEPSLGKAAATVANAHVELQEVVRSLQRYHQQLEFDPQRFETVSHRLAALEKLKRKYGRSIDELILYQNLVEQEIRTLNDAHEHEETLLEKIASNQSSLVQAAQELSNARQTGAAALKITIEQELARLNMPKARFEIEISPLAPSLFGGEHVEFFLVPNVGEPPVSLAGGASGGEISRVMLALHLAQRQSHSTYTLVLDEIDANIGGETARLIGERLKAMGQCISVIAITHFPQMASQGDHHTTLYKEESCGRTVSRAQRISGPVKEQEIRRMEGKRG